jgi:hypothetical protein
VTNASAKKRQLFYHGVGLPTSQLVVDFDFRGTDTLAEFLSRRFAPVKILRLDMIPGGLAPQTDRILHGCPSGPGMFWLGVASRS